MTIEPPPRRQVRASFDDETITVYQAFDAAIADPALEAQRFVPPFSQTRMTWIKPSFLWMMYRCGWATKPGQTRVLGIRIKRSGFEKALSRACLSHFDPDVYKDEAEWRRRTSETAVRVQWDPERDVALRALPWRSLQVGLSGATVADYVDNWTTGIEDVTELARSLGQLQPSERKGVPSECPYAIPDAVMRTIGASAES